MKQTDILPAAPAHVRARALVVLLAACVAALLCQGRASAAITTIGSPLSVPGDAQHARKPELRGVNTSLPPSPEPPQRRSSTPTTTGPTRRSGTRRSPTARRPRPSEGQALQVKLEGCAEAGAGRPRAADPDPPAGHHPASGRRREGGPHLPALRNPGLRAERRQRIDRHHLRTRSTCAWRRGTTSTSTTRAGSSNSTTAAAFPTGSWPRCTGSSSSTPSSRAAGPTTATRCRAANARPWKASPSDQNTELMLQVEFATGPDATHICGGGTKGLPPPLPAMRVSTQKDGVNHSRITKWRSSAGRSPSARAPPRSTYKGKTVGKSGFALNAGTTSHVPIRLSSKFVKRLRKRHSAQRAADGRRRRHDVHADDHRRHLLSRAPSGLRAPAPEAQGSRCGVERERRRRRPSRGQLRRPRALRPGRSAASRPVPAHFSCGLVARPHAQEGGVSLRASGGPRARGRARRRRPAARAQRARGSARRSSRSTPTWRPRAIAQDRVAARVREAEADTGLSASGARPRPCCRSTRGRARACRGVRPRARSGRARRSR